MADHGPELLAVTALLLGLGHSFIDGAYPDKADCWLSSAKSSGQRCYSPLVEVAQDARENGVSQRTTFCCGLHGLEVCLESAFNHYECSREQGKVEEIMNLLSRALETEVLNLDGPCTGFDDFTCHDYLGPFYKTVAEIRALPVLPRHPKVSHRQLRYVDLDSQNATLNLNTTEEDPLQNASVSEGEILPNATKNPKDLQGFPVANSTVLNSTEERFSRALTEVAGLPPFLEEQSMHNLTESPQVVVNFFGDWPSENKSSRSLEYERVRTRALGILEPELNRTGVSSTDDTNSTTESQFNVSTAAEDLSVFRDREWRILKNDSTNVNSSVPEDLRELNASRDREWRNLKDDSTNVTNATEVELDGRDWRSLNGDSTNVTNTTEVELDGILLNSSVPEDLKELNASRDRELRILKNDSADATNLTEVELYVISLNSSDITSLPNRVSNSRSQEIGPEDPESINDPNAILIQNGNETEHLEHGHHIQLFTTNMSNHEESRLNSFRSLEGWSTNDTENLRDEDLVFALNSSGFSNRLNSSRSLETVDVANTTNSTTAVGPEAHEPYLAPNFVVLEVSSANISVTEVPRESRAVNSPALESTAEQLEGRLGWPETDSSNITNTTRGDRAVESTAVDSTVNELLMGRNDWPEADSANVTNVTREERAVELAPVQSTVNEQLVNNVDYLDARLPHSLFDVGHSNV